MFENSPFTSVHLKRYNITLFTGIAPSFLHVSLSGLVLLSVFIDTSIFTLGFKDLKSHGLGDFVMFSFLLEIILLSSVSKCL
jgi:hypothetical protein